MAWQDTVEEVDVSQLQRDVKELLTTIRPEVDRVYCPPRVAIAPAARDSGQRSLLTIGVTATQTGSGGPLKRRICPRVRCNFDVVSQGAIAPSTVKHTHHRHAPAGTHEARVTLGPAGGGPHLVGVPRPGHPCRRCLRAGFSSTGQYAVWCPGWSIVCESYSRESCTCMCARSCCSLRV